MDNLEYYQIGIPSIISKKKDDSQENCNDYTTSDNNKKIIDKNNYEKKEVKTCIKKKICNSPISVTEIVNIKKNMKVNFFTKVSVILIPSRKEYIDIKLNESLWYSLEDYIKFRRNEIIRTKENSI